MVPICTPELSNAYTQDGWLAALQGAPEQVSRELCSRVRDLVTSGDGPQRGW